MPEGVGCNPLVTVGRAWRKDLALPGINNLTLRPVGAFVLVPVPVGAVHLAYVVVGELWRVVMPKKVLVRNRLKQVAEQLASTHIQRCHRSYLVNIDHIKVLRREKEGVFVELGIEGVPDVPISKTYSDSIQKWLTASSADA